jgi:FkbM family methyltransferase
MASRLANKVFAVEPGESFPLLEMNAKLNRASNVVSIRAALTDYVGTTFLIGNSTGAHIGTEGHLTRAVTIDSISANFTVIKLDIEGAEMLALSGLRSFDNIRVMALELQEPNVSGYRINEVLDSLRQKGFSVSTYIDAFSQTTTLSRLVRHLLDFVYCEVQTGFLASKWAVRFWFQAKKNPLLPLSGTPHLKIFYFLRNSKWDKRGRS